MNAAEDGALAGLIVALIPGYRIKLGKPTLNKRQKRPIAAFIFFWLVSILGFVGAPIFLFSTGTHEGLADESQAGVVIAAFLIGVLGIGLLGAIPLNHCYAFYLELCEDCVRWRNWRWKERTFTYPSITFAHVENNGKNGFLRFGSTEMGKRTCSFDPYQFDATILMAQVLYRDDHGRWAEEDGLDVMSVVGMYGSSRDIYAQFYDLCETKYVVGVTKSERQKRRRKAARNEARRLERQQAREEARREARQAKKSRKTNEVSDGIS
ncbi:ECF transporter S component [uncultured Rothia sp.]|uniref:ECF transporter S component n=1 Tax=uncultured Rothia sp. TaxID=316088 RepID=UPI0028DB351F|nr:ECF transporter S component [uncultured Rothia sp.]